MEDATFKSMYQSLVLRARYLAPLLLTAALRRHPDGSTVGGAVDVMKGGGGGGVVGGHFTALSNALHAPAPPRRVFVAVVVASPLVSVA